MSLWNAKSFELAEWKKLISQGANVNEQDVSSGNTPLHSACYQGELELVKLLLEHNVDVNLVNKKLSTALHFVCLGVERTRERQKIVHLLVENKADIDQVDTENSTALHFACTGGDVVLVSTLVQLGASVSAADHQGNTPLHMAVSHGKKEAVLCLISNGAPLNSTNAKGKAPKDLTINPEIKGIIHQASTGIYKGEKIDVLWESPVKTSYGVMPICWWVATVVGVQTERDKKGRIEVQYDGWEDEGTSSVDPTMIRKTKHSTPNYDWSVGDQVEVFDTNMWLAATITGVKPRRIEVKFEYGDATATVLRTQLAIKGSVEDNTKGPAFFPAYLFTPTPPTPPIRSKRKAPSSSSSAAPSPAKATTPSPKRPAISTTTMPPSPSSPQPRVIMTIKRPSTNNTTNTPATNGASSPSDGGTTLSSIQKLLEQVTDIQEQQKKKREQLNTNKAEVLAEHEKQLGSLSKHLQEEMGDWPLSDDQLASEKQKLEENMLAKLSELEKDHQVEASKQRVFLAQVESKVLKWEEQMNRQVEELEQKKGELNKQLEEVEKELEVKKQTRQKLETLRSLAAST
jgi:hypothetical protein